MNDTPAGKKSCAPLDGHPTSELYPIGTHLADYEFETEAEMATGYRGIIVAVNDDSRLVWAEKDGVKSEYKADYVVAVSDPASGASDAGLPSDPEIWAPHHRMIFLQRELDAACRRESEARDALVERPENAIFDAGIGLIDACRKLKFDFDNTTATLGRAREILATTSEGWRLCQEELDAAKKTNAEDLAKLNEAVELGAKQAEEFDSLYSAAQAVKDAAVKDAEMARAEAARWKECAQKLYQVPHSLEGDQKVAREAWATFRELSGTADASMAAISGNDEEALPAKSQIPYPDSVRRRPEKER